MWKRRVALAPIQQIDGAVMVQIVVLLQSPGHRRFKEDVLLIQFQRPDDPPPLLPSPVAIMDENGDGDVVQLKVY